MTYDPHRLRPRLDERSGPDPAAPGPDGRRLHWRSLRGEDQLPAAVIDVVAEQLGVEPREFDLYARRDETRREHASEIIAHLDLRTIRQADYRSAMVAGAAAAVGTERGESIMRATIDDLKTRRIIVPPAALVERFALAGRALARRQAYRGLIRGLDAVTRERLETLLSARVEDDPEIYSPAAFHDADWAALASQAGEPLDVEGWKRAMRERQAAGLR